VSKHFRLGEGQVALAHVDGQRAVERREDDAEPSSRPMAAAIANAVFDATGVRLRRVPFAPDRVRAALS
jgi:hypothetical protein